MDADGDAVVFDSTGIGNNNGSVVVDVPVAPSKVTFQNFSGTYILSGSGAIQDGGLGPTALTMEADGGQLNMNMSNNTYSGGTNLKSGVLQIGADGVISSGTLASGPLGVGQITLSGGTLQDDGLPPAAPCSTPS